MNLSSLRFTHRPSMLMLRAFIAAGVLGAAACSSGGGDDTGGSTAGDEARRAVLADIGEDIILPALRDFDGRAALLRISLDALAGTPADATARAGAQQAWRDAMASWQRSEVLQVGPAGRSSGEQMTAGGADFRDRIYSWPLISLVGIDCAAYRGDNVDASTPIDRVGLGALEHLLFSEGVDPAGCENLPANVDRVAARAIYAQKQGTRLAAVATDLRTRWEPAPPGGNFLAQWSTAGAGSQVYARPQAALDALSVALFYTEKETKDLKIANPTGLGATGLSPCATASCPERLESRPSKHSGQNIRVNLQALRDVFTGLNGGMGINDLLRGIGRSDIADRLTQRIDAALAHLATIPSFDDAVAAIPSRSECSNANATAANTGNTPAPAACSLNGLVKRAEDTFTTDVVGALSLARPNRAAGDND